MLRAIALAARLDFTSEPMLVDAIRTHRHEIAKASLPRLLEEYYKILRAGSSEKAFRVLAEVGLLEPISAELHLGATDPLWKSLAALDAYRRQFQSTPETLTNSILLGSLLVPLGISLHPPRSRSASDDHRMPTASTSDDHRMSTGSTSDDHRMSTGWTSDGNPMPTGSRRPRRPPIPRLADLPLPRRDVERLRQIIGLQRRLKHPSAAPRVQRALAHRGIFRDALTWLAVPGGTPDLVAPLKALVAASVRAP